MLTKNSWLNVYKTVYKLFDWEEFLCLAQNTETMKCLWKRKTNKKNSMNTPERSRQRTAEADIKEVY